MIMKYASVLVRLNNNIQFGFAASAVIAAGLLLPLIRFTGFSEVMEECAKAAVVLMLIQCIAGRLRQIILVTLFGLFFGLSEGALYLSSYFFIGTPAIVLLRLLLTVPMHVSTAMLLLWFTRFGKWYLFLGVMAVITAHLAFNAFVAAGR
jgi:hypothetical protein